MINSGNWLFQRRSWLPLVLYVFMVILIWQTKEEALPYSFGWTFQSLPWMMICLIISSLGLLIRILTIGFTPKNTSGRNTKGQVADALNSSGIYATVRHPLYVGNYLMWLGLVLYVGNFWFVIIVSLIYWLYYERIMFAEEAFLRNKFGEQYVKWAEKVPAFIPKLSKWSKANLSFSIKNVLKREYNGLMNMVISFALINFLKHWFYFQQFNMDTFWKILTPLIIILALTLRTISKKTKWLEVEGR